MKSSHLTCAPTDACKVVGTKVSTRTVVTPAKRVSQPPVELVKRSNSKAVSQARNSLRRLWLGNTRERSARCPPAKWPSRCIVGGARSLGRDIKSEAGAKDRARIATAGVPESNGYQPKGQLALVRPSLFCRQPVPVFTGPIGDCEGK